MSETPSHRRVQYFAFALLSVGALGLTAISSLSSDTPFRRYFGAVNPLLAVALVIVLGFASLGFLLSRGWFEIFSTGRVRRGVVVAATVATLFAVAVVPADYLIRFPRDLNVPAPESLFFYPAIGYVVEVTFHTLPLALLLLLLSPFWRQWNRNTLVWLCIVLASTLEPSLQLRLGYSGSVLSWAEVYVAVHVFAFNLAEFYLFRRYDFVSMYALRLVYYLYWHIVWGYLRLHWLF